MEDVMLFALCFACLSNLFLWPSASAIVLVTSLLEVIWRIRVGLWGNVGPKTL